MSLTYDGSGQNGSWTDQDWQAYTAVQDVLGGDLLTQIGKQGPSGGDLYTLVGTLVEGILGGRGVDFQLGPDGTVIANSFLLPPGASAITLGNLIVLGPDAVGDRAVLMHEFVHVLQYRASGVGYVADYWDKGGFYNWQSNALEVQGRAVEQLYRANRWLPPIWDIPRSNAQAYWSTP